MVQRANNEKDEMRHTKKKIAKTRSIRNKISEETKL